MREEEMRERKEREEREEKVKKTFLTIEEVSKILKVSRPTVRNLIRDRRLLAVKAGKRIFRISQATLEDFISGEEEENN